MASHRRIMWHNRGDRRLREIWTRPEGAARAVQGVTIRPARPDDARSLRRLAALDSAEVPPGGLLVAEVSGELWAAVNVSGGHAIADPFRPTAALVRLLEVRAGQLGEDEVRPAAPTGLTRVAPWRWRGAA